MFQRSPKPGGLLCGSAALVALFLAWVLVAGDDRTTRNAARAPADPEALPAIALVRLDGSAAQLRQLHPDRATLVNFWATWCAPCRSELPSLQRLSDSLDSERFAVVGISVDEDSDFVREYLNDAGITFANYLAAHSRSLPKDLDIASFPHTLLLRPDGTVAGRVTGPRDWAAPDQRALVQALWSARQPKQPRVKQGEAP